MIMDYEYLNEEVKSSYTKFYKDKIKKLQSKENLMDEIKELSKKVKWMDKCSILLENDKVIHGVKEINCNVMFCKKNECNEHISLGLDDYDRNPNGFFIHTDCWKYIKKNYNIKLKFSNLPPYTLTNTKIFKMNYGDIEKYWEQDFDFPQIVFDNKQYLCSSPLKKDKNISQINKNISNLKIKNDPDRKGPAVSATFYKEGAIKIGNNKMFWIIKSKKWVQINEKPKKIKIKSTEIKEKIPYIGHHNTKPIFLVSTKILKNTSNFKPKRVSKKIVAGPSSNNIEYELLVL